MIKNIGIDNIELSRIEKAYTRNERFAARILTISELEIFEKYSGQRKIEYLAGRWAAKEAFSKAWGSGIGEISFQDLEILNDEQGAPYFSKSPFNGLGNVFVSISHSNLEAIAFIILEKS